MTEEDGWMAVGRVTRVVGSTETERSLVEADTLKPSIEATCVEGHANLNYPGRRRNSPPQSRTHTICYSMTPIIPNMFD